MLSSVQEKTPDDRRGHHFRDKVRDGVYTSPSVHCKTWEATSSALESKLRAMNMGHVLQPLERAKGFTCKSIFMHLILCDLDGCIKLEKTTEEKEAEGSSSTGKPSFFGITSFTIIDLEAFDRAPDEVGAVHSVAWAKQAKRSVHLKTIRKHWSDVGMKESKSDPMVYTFCPVLWSKHDLVMHKDGLKKRKRGQHPPAIVKAIPALYCSAPPLPSSPLSSAHTFASSEDASAFHSVSRLSALASVAASIMADH